MERTKYECVSKKSRDCEGLTTNTYYDGTWGYKAAAESDFSKRRREKYPNDRIELVVPMCRACFTWEFWDAHARAYESEHSPNTVIVNHKHYSIGNENAGGPQSFRGFGGSKFHIQFFDGRDVTSTNLWHQGEIPEEFWDRLPDNAEFVRDWKEPDFTKFQGGPYNCFNCIEHNHVCGTPPSIKICNAPFFVRGYEFVLRKVHQAAREAFYRLPVLWTKKCRECAEVKVPDDGLCENCYYNEQMAEYYAAAF